MPEKCAICVYHERDVRSHGGYTSAPCRKCDTHMVTCNACWKTWHGVDRSTVLTEHESQCSGIPGRF